MWTGAYPLGGSGRARELTSRVCETWRGFEGEEIAAMTESRVEFFLEIMFKEKDDGHGWMCLPDTGTKAKVPKNVYFMIHSKDSGLDKKK